ncbi:hypothetical protein [Synechocystis sp. PCC 7509]|uniref:hypothetical protein n=1 Tax=Synechocystis sp. PCC 7509 TaxID=927677 RepID=UPI0002AD1915|nr:hypothetical protein [Synechocystis sp. PCC 7509]
MKIEFSSELHPDRKVSITLPESPFLLRLNKQVGCFATGLIEQYNHESMETYGRGKWLECAIAKFDDDLHGIVGMGESKQWGFVSAIVTRADDFRIEPGCLVHFLTYRAERISCTRLENENTRKVPYILRINFNLSIPTQHGKVIRPPSISKHQPNRIESQYLESAKSIVKNYPDYLPDATSLYPAKYNSQTNKLISGLVHRKTLVVPKATNSINLTSLKRFSKLFWSTKT